MRYLGSTYIAVAILVLTFVLGLYVDVRNEDMHVRHLGISTRLERIVRLEQELTSLLSGAVLEEKLLRVSRYDSVDEHLTATVGTVAELSRELELSGDISVLLDLQKGLRVTEARSLRHMRAGNWGRARAVLFEDDYVLAKKIYEITTESVISALSDELAERARQLEQMRQLAYGLRLAALGLLVWVGWMFSRRLRSEVAEQARLQQEIVTANEQLEQSVRERTAELEAANHQLAALSSTDALTGLANRRRFDEVWESEWQRAARMGLPLALALIDVDYFKAYNDHYGHQAGDACLRQVASLLAAEARRSGELVARYGGEEFVLVLPGATAAEARNVAERIRAAVEGRAMPHEHSPVAGVVTISIGVASVRVQRAEQAEALLKESDVALYLAKHQGRNRVMTAA
ncbi:diguanylate cyclase [Curvibacter sp. PAE-UM]|uniref:GGDEF domain-containing protein n=1 Tax=Curvibacter sp. PAE-UM TaxID=1714344 RepID=UPI0012E3B35D|nr:diguanylate cyclase [Curvibacter sp. PAE-UM]